MQLHSKLLELGLYVIKLQECKTRMPEQDRGTVDSEFFKIALDVDFAPLRNAERGALFFRVSYKGQTM